MTGKNIGDNNGNNFNERKDRYSRYASGDDFWRHENEQDPRDSKHVRGIKKKIYY